MTNLPATRRVVTGLNAEGRSAFIFDGPLPHPGRGADMVWRAPSFPVDNSGNAETAVAFDMGHLHDGGINFMVGAMPPGLTDAPFMHATDTIDFLVMISGEVVLMVETGETTLRAGDCIVDRGVIHAWRNDGAVPAHYAVVNIPAHPVGNGRTV